MSPGKTTLKTTTIAGTVLLGLLVDILALFEHISPNITSWFTHHIALLSDHLIVAGFLIVSALIFIGIIWLCGPMFVKWAIDGCLSVLGRIEAMDRKSKRAMAVFAALMIVAVMSAGSYGAYKYFFPNVPAVTDYCDSKSVSEVDILYPIGKHVRGAYDIETIKKSKIATSKFTDCKLVIAGSSSIDGDYDKNVDLSWARASDAKTILKVLYEITVHDKKYLTC